MGDYNKWVKVTTELNKRHDTAKAQVNKILQDMLDMHVERVKLGIKSNNYGAIATQDRDAEGGIWMVQWIGNPFKLQQDQRV